MAPSTEERYTVTLPDLTNEEAASQFLTELEQHMSVRGVKKLYGLVGKIRDHIVIAHKQINQAERTSEYVNGVRIKVYTSEGGKIRGLRSTARRFFDSLNTAALRQQCTFYEVDYEAFDDVDARIETLVNRYMEELTA